MSYDDLPPFLRVEQAMELLQLGRSQLYALTNRWLETGGKEGIPVVKFGRCLRIPTAAVLRMALTCRARPATPMPPEVLIEHRYPAALAFLRAHWGHALAVLHDLLARAERHNGALVARASTRDIAERLQFLSKDTVHRSLRQLARAGVIEALGRRSGSSFAPTTYLVHLDDSGITVLPDDRSA